MAKRPLARTLSNRILARLSTKDRNLLQPHLETVELPARFKLIGRNQRIEHAYFIDSGVAAVVANGTERPIEIGVVGREGVAGLSVIMQQERATHEVVTIVPGRGRRIPAAALRTADEQSLTLHRVLMRAVFSLIAQMTFTALANGRCKIDERLARWLLLADDRVNGDLPLTHEVLSRMLGTTRSLVTIALQSLENEGLVECSRKAIKILDRGGLVAKSKGTYVEP